MVGLRALEVERVVDRHGNLPGHLLQERDFIFGVAVRPQTAEAQHAQAALGRRQRHRACGLHAVLAQDLQQRGEARFLRDIVQDKRLLGFPDPPGRSFADGKFGAGANGPGPVGLQDVQPHDVARSIVQGQRKVIKFHDPVKPGRKLVKQFAQIVVLGNGLGHLEQRLVLLLRGSACQRAYNGVAHTSENNIPVRRGSTCGKQVRGTATAMPCPYTRFLWNAC